MPGQTEVREQQKEKLSRNLTCSHNIYPHPFCLREKKKRGFAIGICKVNPCVFDERSPCSGLKSLVEARSFRINMYLYVSTPNYSGKDQRGNPYQVPHSARPTAVHQSQRLPRGWEAARPSPVSPLGYQDS